VGDMREGPYDRGLQSGRGMGAASDACGASSCFRGLTMLIRPTTDTVFFGCYMRAIDTPTLDTLLRNDRCPASQSRGSGWLELLASSSQLHWCCVGLPSSNVGDHRRRGGGGGAGRGAARKPA
jgi:hypothetical protein